MDRGNSQPRRRNSRLGPGVALEYDGRRVLEQAPAVRAREGRRRRDVVDLVVRRALSRVRAHAPGRRPRHPRRGTGDTRRPAVAPPESSATCAGKRRQGRAARHRGRPPPRRAWSRRRRRAAAARALPSPRPPRPPPAASRRRKAKSCWCTRSGRHPPRPRPQQAARGVDVHVAEFRGAACAARSGTCSEAVCTMASAPASSGASRAVSRTSATSTVSGPGRRSTPATW